MSHHLGRPRLSFPQGRQWASVAVAVDPSLVGRVQSHYAFACVVVARCILLDRPCLNLTELWLYKPRGHMDGYVPYGGRWWMGMVRGA